jgi:hypothetical protein
VTVTLTVLTGRRPKLLVRTLDSFVVHNRQLWEDAHKVVYVNGSDNETVETAGRYGFNEVLTSDELEPIGPAISRLAQTVQCRWWLHLEDDWQSTGPADVELAQNILDRYPKVSQVRLRDMSERVMRRHRVDRRPIRWKRRGGWLHAEHAHLTFNPSLVRASDIPDGWPCDSELDAMRRWLQAGHRQVAQLVPGSFAHIGHDSLRAKFGRE